MPLTNRLVALSAAQAITEAGGTIMPLAVSMQVTFGHFSATNGADESGHAGNAAAGNERRDGGRRGHDLVDVCSVAAAHAAAAAAGAGRRQRQGHIATASDH